jgi:2,3,4,5-tetrahydropyridine-2,6-dicarboxylate N-acetyltransferase
MNAQEIINYISSAEGKTPVRLYLKAKKDIAFPGCKVFGTETDKIVFGDWADIEPVLEASKDDIIDQVIENDRRNSGVGLLDMKNIRARIEPGVTIREKVEIGENVVIMMGAVINIGSVIGEGTMIDMNAVLGGRATVGKNCHIGAGTVLAGVVEPASATPVIVEDGVLIGANCVVLEGVRVGKGSVVAAGSVVVEDVPEGVVVAGTPAKIIKKKDAKTDSKTGLVDSLRNVK